MPYTLFLTYSLNFLLMALTGGIYWFNINLWNDQAILLSSGIGGVLSSFTLLSLGVALLKKNSGGGLKDYTLLLFITFCFLAQLLCLGYCFWLKPL